MKIKRPPSPLQKRARRGFRGYPVATIAFYGPDSSRASKVAVGVVTKPKGEAEVLERWFSERADVRFDAGIGREILAFLERHAVKSVVLSGGVIGCPHEEGIDYPEGQVCPQCPYWATRDRWTGDLLHEQ
jgi:hypothetical protein